MMSWLSVFQYFCSYPFTVVLRSGDEEMQWLSRQQKQLISHVKLVYLANLHPSNMLHLDSDLQKTKTTSSKRKNFFF